jgi:glycosyltransferase involved in cell wall biosynthesis
MKKGEKAGRKFPPKKTMDFREGTPVFVMPLWVEKQTPGEKHFEEAVNSIFNQTDHNWNLIIVDDCSPSPFIRTYLKGLKEKYAGKVEVILKQSNDGPGYCRNIGVEWAYNRGAPFILFNDADDISLPRRLERVRRAFLEKDDISVVYSTFEIIDEYSGRFPHKKVPASILEILQWHVADPPQGENTWIDIGTRTGYVNLTSATAVTADVAFRFPFPRERVSEDWHTWVRYSAGGGEFCFVPEILTYYRIPLNSEGSSSRSREGGKRKFYRIVVKNNTAGFKQAIELALKNRKIKSEEKDELLVRFYVTLARSMALEQMFDLMGKLLEEAGKISRELTGKVIREKEIKEFINMSFGEEL